MQRYAITDRALLRVDARGAAWCDLETALCQQVEPWVAAGIEWVQLREKDLPESTLAALVRSLAAITRKPGSKTRLLVNGLPPRLAVESGADGVHLPGSAAEGSLDRLRRAVQVARIATVGCHTLKEVQAAREGGASAILWAPVFGKSVHGKEVLAGSGLAALRAACAAAAPVPVFALGGISPANAASCVLAGAAGVAGIRLFHSDGWQAL